MFHIPLGMNGAHIMNELNFEKAEQIYASRLRGDLERTHPHFFVAIEPESGDHFLGETLSEAAAGARAAYPDRRSCILRVGHRAAVHIGVLVHERHR
jgi:hypothetical protein